MARKPVREVVRKPGAFIGRDGEELSLEPEDSTNILEVPEEFRDPDWDRQWIRTSCLNAPDPGNINKMHRNGWRPVTQAQMTGYLNNGSEPEAAIEHDGLMLVERPVSMTQAERQRHLRRDAEQLARRADASLEVLDDLNRRHPGFEGRRRESFVRRGEYETVDPAALRDGGQDIL
jgi:hypothetical protein